MFNVVEVETQTSSKRPRVIIFLVPVVIIVLVSAFFLFPRKFDYQNLLKNKEKEIVYTSNSSDILATDKVPVINVDSPVIDDINSDIMKYYQDYLTKFTQGFLYEYSVSDHVLSLLIISQQRYVDADYSDVYYRSYNIVNVMNDNTYYIENGKLILYKPFNIYTSYGEEEYFSLDSFRFVVKD